MVSTSFSWFSSSDWSVGPCEVDTSLWTSSVGLSSDAGSGNLERGIPGEVGLPEFSECESSYWGSLAFSVVALTASSGVAEFSIHWSHVGIRPELLRLALYQ